jgi:hypothetical protein
VYHLNIYGKIRQTILLEESWSLFLFCSSPPSPLLIIFSRLNCTLYNVSVYCPPDGVSTLTLLSKNITIRIYKTIILPVVLYGCETWSLTLREEHRLKVFENRVLRRIFGPKRCDANLGKVRQSPGADM